MYDVHMATNISPDQLAIPMPGDPDPEPAATPLSWCGVSEPGPTICSLTKGHAGLHVFAAHKVIEVWS